MSSPVNRLLEIRIRKDDSRTLPTKFESDVLEVALRSGLHDFPTDEGRAGERDLLDGGVVGDRMTGNGSVSDDEVEDTRGEAGFVNHFGGHKSGQRSHLGGFHDDGVSGSESGANLPTQHQDCERRWVRTSVLLRERMQEGRTREVPGDDLANDTNRFMAGVDEFIVAGLDGLTVDLVGPSSVIPNGADGEGDVRVLRPLEGFA